MIIRQNPRNELELEKMGLLSRVEQEWQARPAVGAAIPPYPIRGDQHQVSK